MKKIFAVLTALVLVFSLSVPTMAASNWVMDDAGLLTSEDIQALDQQATLIADEYQCGVYILTVPDYTSSGYSDISEFAQAYYSSSGLGTGEGKDGIMLTLSMADRDYNLIAYGYGNIAFTDYGKDELAETFLDDFADDYWYDGFADYMDTCDEYIQSARAGAPVDISTEQTSAENTSIVPYISIAFIISLIIAAIICWITKRRMKTAGEAVAASEYVAPGGIDYRVKKDNFSHITETVRHIDTSSSSSGGTSVNSSGFSSSSGKF